MTPRDIAALACKILGLYTLINALRVLPLAWMPVLGMISRARNSPAGKTSLLHILPEVMVGSLPSVLIAFAGWWLWANARMLATRMVPDVDEPATLPAVGVDWERLAFSCIGLFTLMQALPDLGQILLGRVILGAGDSLIYRGDPYMVVGGLFGAIIQIGLQIGLGLWLLLGAGGLVRYIRSLRYAGMDAEYREEQAARESQ